MVHNFNVILVKCQVTKSLQYNSRLLLLLHPMAMPVKYLHTTIKKKVKTIANLPLKLHEKKVSSHSSTLRHLSTCRHHPLQQLLLPTNTRTEISKTLKFLVSDCCFDIEKNAEVFFGFGFGFGFFFWCKTYEPTHV